MKNIKITNIEGFFSDFKMPKIKGMQYSSAENYEIIAFDIKPLEGFEFPQNKDSDKVFPFCCEYYNEVFKRTKDWLNIFPNCCEMHKKLNNEQWFNKKNYEYLPLKMTMQISYTIHCIDVNINLDNWYKLITDYFYWNFTSFGQLPINFHTSMGYLLYTDFIKEYLDKNIENDKAIKLKDYFNNEIVTDEKESKRDLNLLEDVYRRWLKVFPFDLEYFISFKPIFNRYLIFVEKETMETNVYSGITKVKIQTKKKLILWLLDVTKELFLAVDVPNLVKEGCISDFDAEQLLLNETVLKTKVITLTESFSKGELQYVKALKSWLKYHKEYFNQIKPLMAKVKGKTNKEPTILEKYKNEFIKAYANGFIFDMNEKKAKDLEFDGQKITDALISNEIVENSDLRSYISVSNMSFDNSEKSTQKHKNIFLKKDTIIDFLNMSKDFEYDKRFIKKCKDYQIDYDFKLLKVR